MRYPGRSTAMQFEQHRPGRHEADARSARAVQVRPRPPHLRSAAISELRRSPSYYLDLVRGVYRRDSAERRYAATIAVIWNLAKVMLIKDEPYVSYLLTRYEKKQRDIVKYGIDVSNGDRIVYRHHTSPEFNLGKRRLRLKITTSDWMLQIVRHCKWSRKLPGWHQREVAFRDWYIGLLGPRQPRQRTPPTLQAVRVFKCPEEVTGYREVRYPKQDRVRDLIESELTRQVTPPPESPASVMDALRAPAQV